MFTTLADSPHANSPDRSTPLRIVIGGDTFPPDVNGAANFASRLAAGLTERGHSVEVMAPAFNASHGRFVEKHDGAEFVVHRLFSLRWYPHDWLRWAMPWTIRGNAARVLDEFKPDVVHIQSHIIVGRGLVHEARKRGIRVIGTNHFMPENMIDHTRLPRFIRKFAIKTAWRDASQVFVRCDVVTSPSRKAADFLESETALHDVHAVSCGIEAALYTPNFERPKENRVVFVGRVTGEKHIDVLLRAISEMDPRLQVTLEIIGGGDQMNQLKQMTRDLGIEDRVIFTGYVTNEQLRDALARATVFAMPSIAELQSIATMEAMASALPVVAADAMALPHLVHDGQNGFLFAPGDSKDLAAKLSAVMSLSDADYLAMKEASIRYIAPHDIQHTLTVFERLYRGEEVIDPVTDGSLDKNQSPV